MEVLVPHLELRGVHKPCWKRDGYPILVAVDRFGNERAVQLVYNPADEEALVASMYDALDAIDPQLEGAHG